MGRRGRRGGVTPSRQARSLSCGVETTHLRTDRGEAGHAEHQHRHQCDQGKRGFDGAGAAVIVQTLVLSARLMMPVKAPTIESPVTTL